MTLILDIRLHCSKYTQGESSQNYIKFLIVNLVFFWLTSLYFHTFVLIY